MIGNYRSGWVRIKISIRVRIRVAVNGGVTFNVGGICLSLEQLSREQNFVVVHQ